MKTIIPCSFRGTLQRGASTWSKVVKGRTATQLSPLPLDEATTSAWEDVGPDHGFSGERVGVRFQLPSIVGVRKVQLAGTPIVNRATSVVRLLRRCPNITKPEGWAQLRGPGHDIGAMPICNVPMHLWEGVPVVWFSICDILDCFNVPPVYPDTQTGQWENLRLIIDHV